MPTSRALPVTRGSTMKCLPLFFETVSISVRRGTPPASDADSFWLVGSWPKATLARAIATQAIPALFARVHGFLP